MFKEFETDYRQRKYTKSLTVILLIFEVIRKRRYKSQRARPIIYFTS